jgi:hypothetical protein
VAQSSIRKVRTDCERKQANHRPTSLKVVSNFCKRHETTMAVPNVGAAIQPRLATAGY